MSEQTLMVVIGGVLVAASFLARGIPYGMPSHRDRPIHRMMPGLRILLLSLGLLSLGMGITGLLRR